MNDNAVKATLSNVADLLGAADNVETAGMHDVALRYRAEAAGLLSDLGHGLLARADREITTARTKYTVACQRAQASLESAFKAAR